MGQCTSAGSLCLGLRTVIFTGSVFHFPFRGPLEAGLPFCRCICVMYSFCVLDNDLIRFFWWCHIMHSMKEAYWGKRVEQRKMLLSSGFSCGWGQSGRTHIKAVNQVAPTSIKNRDFYICMIHAFLCLIHYFPIISHSRVRRHGL